MRWVAAGDAVQELVLAMVRAGRLLWSRLARPGGFLGSCHQAGGCPGRGRGAEAALGHPAPRKGSGPPPAAPSPPVRLAARSPRVPLAVDTSPSRTGLRPRAGVCWPQSTGDAHVPLPAGPMHPGVGCGKPPPPPVWVPPSPPRCPQPSHPTAHSCLWTGCLWTGGCLWPWVPARCGVPWGSLAHKDRREGCGATCRGLRDGHRGAWGPPWGLQ